MRARLDQPFPNEQDTFTLPGEEDASASPLSESSVSWVAAQRVADATRAELGAAGAATFFSEREEAGSTYVIAYFVDKRHDTLVLKDVDVFV